jgi:putative ABC transport system permease protein
MTRLRVLLSRLIDPLRRRSRDRRLDDELQAHLDLLIEDHLARGLSLQDARRAARRAFGNVDRVRADCRDERGLPALDALVQDVRFALRQTARDPAFTMTAVLILGLGIGVNNMFFTIVYAHTLRGLPMERVDRVLSIGMLDGRTPSRGVSYPDFDELRRSTTLAGIAAFTTAPVVVFDDDHAPERAEGAFVSAEAFEVAGVRPVLGRTFTLSDELRGAAAVVVLGRGLWRSRYGADPGIAGRSIVVDGIRATVVGVVPERSGFPSTAEIWMPLPHHPGAAAGRTERILTVFGRLRDPATIAEAREEIGAIVESLAREHPDAHTALRAHVVPINEQYLGSPRHPAWLAFMAAGCLIVLISCANVANLLLARAAGRTREIAIRTALGASRARVVRQLLVEAAVLAALGGAAGLVVAMASVRLFSSAIPEHVLPYWFDYTFDARVLSALALVSAATVCVFALLPAFHASRTNVDHVLRAGGQADHARRGSRWSTLALAGQLALAVVLLAHLAVAMRTPAADPPAERALDTARVVTAAITLPAATYRTPEVRDTFFDRLRERLDGIPDTSASLTSALPLMGGQPREIAIAGRPAAAGDRIETVTAVFVAPRYFATLGVALVSGRELVAADGLPGQYHAVVSERFVAEFLGGAAPLGQRFTLGEPGSDGDPRWFTIAGVAPAIRQRPGQPPGAVVYLPHRLAPTPDTSLVVRSSLDTGALVTLLRAEVQALDPDLPLYQVRTMAQVVRDADWNGRLSNRLFLYITVIAVVLATAGLFSVAAYGVSTRTREIGLRIALGAGSLDVVRLVVRRAAVQAALGFAAGLALTKLWAWMFPAGLPDVSTTDPQSLAIVAAILIVMMLVACIVPARRAARLDPLTALRHE